MISLTTLQVILLATIATGITGGLLSWWQRPKPGAVPLTILLAGQCWWSTVLFFRITETGLQNKIFWVNISWVGIAILPVAWLFFSLAYTGYGHYMEPRYVVSASIIPAITIILGSTNEIHHLMYVDSVLVVIGGETVLDRTPGFWFWVIGAYTYSLGFLGAVPLLQFVTSQVNMFKGQSLAILFGLVVPWLTNILYLLGVFPTGGIDPTPIAFSFSALAFLGALTQFQLFETSPTPIRSARQLSFDRMEGGVIILDQRNNIVDLNEEATNIIGNGSAETLGNPVNSVLPESGEITNGSSNVDQFLLDPDDHSGKYDISVNEITDNFDRPIGKIVTLHDISQYLRQQQRLKVLNRVFRHNVRTNTQIIVGQAEFLTQQGVASKNDHDIRAKKIKRNATEIKEFSDKIRVVLEMFDQGMDEARTTPVEDVITTNLNTLQDSSYDVAIHRNLDPNLESLYVDARLDDIFSNILENAAKHNTNSDPKVWVDVTRRDNRIEIVVADNGPGIPDEELALVDEGTETPLNHGSGLGLALVVWGTDIIGGEIDFEPNDPTGVVVTLEAPVYPRLTNESHT